MDLLKKQVVAQRLASPSLALPPGTQKVAVTIGLDAVDQGTPILVELWGRFAGKWLHMADYDRPGPPVSVHEGQAERIFIVVDPSRPVSVGATITLS